MNKWRNLSIALAVLLLLACISLAGVGVWAFANFGKGSSLAELPLQTPTLPVDSTPRPQDTPQPAPAKPPAGRLAQLAGAFGLIQSVSGNSIVLAASTGKSETLSVTSRTRIIFVGKIDASVADLQAGDKLLALGTRNGTDFEPRAVVVAPPDYDSMNLRVGIVLSVGSGSVMLQTRSGPVSVTTDGESQVLSVDLRQVQLADLKQDDQVIAIGKPNSDGTFTGQLIVSRTAQSSPVSTGRRQPTPSASPTPGQ